MGLSHQGQRRSLWRVGVQDYAESQETKEINIRVIGTLYSLGKHLYFRRKRQMRTRNVGELARRLWKECSLKTAKRHGLYLPFRTALSKP